MPLRHNDVIKTKIALSKMQKFHTLKKPINFFVVDVNASDHFSK